MKKHYDIRPYTCQICLQSFSRNSTLKMHLNTHVVTKPYICSYNNCGKSFVDKAQVKYHMKSHYKGLTRKNFERIFSQYLDEKKNEINELSDKRNDEIKEKVKDFKEIKPKLPKFIRKNNSYHLVAKDVSQYENMKGIIKKTIITIINSKLLQINNGILEPEDSYLQKKDDIEDEEFDCWLKKKLTDISYKNTDGSIDIDKLVLRELWINLNKLNQKNLKGSVDNRLYRVISIINRIFLKNSKWSHVLTGCDGVNDSKNEIKSITGFSLSNYTFNDNVHSSYNKSNCDYDSDEESKSKSKSKDLESKKIEITKYTNDYLGKKRVLKTLRKINAQGLLTNANDEDDVMEDKSLPNPKISKNMVKMLFKPFTKLLNKKKKAKEIVKLENTNNLITNKTPKKENIQAIFQQDKSEINSKNSKSKSNCIKKEDKESTSMNKSENASKNNISVSSNKQNGFIEFISKILDQQSEKNKNHITSTENKKARQVNEIIKKKTIHNLVLLEEYFNNPNLLQTTCNDLLGISDTLNADKQKENNFSKSIDNAEDSELKDKINKLFDDIVCSTKIQKGDENLNNNINNFLFEKSALNSSISENLNFNIFSQMPNNFNNLLAKSDNEDFENELEKIRMFLNLRSLILKGNSTHSEINSTFNPFSNKYQSSMMKSSVMDNSSHINKNIPDYMYSPNVFSNLRALEKFGLKTNFGSSKLDASSCLNTNKMNMDISSPMINLLNNGQNNILKDLSEENYKLLKTTQAQPSNTQNFSVDKKFMNNLNEMQNKKTEEKKNIINPQKTDNFKAPTPIATSGFSQFHNKAQMKYSKFFSPNDMQNLPTNCWKLSSNNEKSKTVQSNLAENKEKINSNENSGKKPQSNNKELENSNKNKNLNSSFANQNNQNNFINFSSFNNSNRFNNDDYLNGIFSNEDNLIKSSGLQDNINFPEDMNINKLLFNQESNVFSNINYLKSKNNFDSDGNLQFLLSKSLDKDKFDNDNLKNLEKFTSKAFQNFDSEIQQNLSQIEHNFVDKLTIMNKLYKIHSPKIVVENPEDFKLFINNQYSAKSAKSNPSINLNIINKQSESKENESISKFMSFLNSSKEKFNDIANIKILKSAVTVGSKNNSKIINHCKNPGSIKALYSSNSQNNLNNYNNLIGMMKSPNNYFSSAINFNSETVTDEKSGEGNKKKITIDELKLKSHKEYELTSIQDFSMGEKISSRCASISKDKIQSEANTELSFNPIIKNNNQENITNEKQKIIQNEKDKKPNNIDFNSLLENSLFFKEKINENSEKSEKNTSKH